MFAGPTGGEIGWTYVPASPQLPDIPAYSSHPSNPVCIPYLTPGPSPIIEYTTPDPPGRYCNNGVGR